MKARAKRLDSVLIKPAGPDCNMACSYCFYLDKASLFPHFQVHRMNEAVLEETIRQVMSQAGPSVSIGWQGGEPTLMGLPFFEQAVKFEKRYGQGKSIGNGLQTNGLLLDGQWAEFLKTYHFLVGISLDGPEHIHNRYRSLQGGQDSWSRVTDRANLLLDAHVEVNALTVVNDYSVRFPHEIYSFLKEMGLTYMQFIPCIETDPHDTTKASPFSVSANLYGDFLIALFDLWTADFSDNSPTTSIRFFDSLFYCYVDLSPPECTLLPSCGVYVVVEHNGDVFSCDFFVEPEWKLGNVMEASLTDMLNSKLQSFFGQKKASLPESCQNCKWLSHCRGGCTKDRIRDPRDSGLNHFCESYKMFFEYADGEFKQLAQKWKEEGREAQFPAESQKTVVSRNDPCPCGSGKKYKKCCGA